MPRNQSWDRAPALSMVLALGLAGACNAVVGIEPGVLCNRPDGDCEASPDPDGSGAVPCMDCALRCLPPWQGIDLATGHCYLLERKEKQQWSAADKACQELGGTLAAITSDREIDLTAALIREATWIGGSDSAETGTYTWSDGEPWWMEAPWVHGTPDSSGDKHCVRLSLETSVAFDNAKCGTKLPYLCEKR